jgi:hypothetical protein
VEVMSLHWAELPLTFGQSPKSTQVQPPRILLKMTCLVSQTCFGLTLVTTRHIMLVAILYRIVIVLSIPTWITLHCQMQTHINGDCLQINKQEKIEMNSQERSQVTMLILTWTLLTTELKAHRRPLNLLM